MAKISADYIERVYAGWLGKMIGVRSGANIEMWSAERIERAFGELNGYPHDFKNFAADDDTNGPAFFIRALGDFSCSEALTAEQIGQTWLNYVPDSRRFFWWGGYGASTENTAYLNLKNGITAPRSGSIPQNGKTMAEQIGGQIFIDSWGLVCPQDAAMAARFAEKAASVSHGGNGIYGGMFIAAAIAAAFGERDIAVILKTALAQIPADCDYARMVRTVMDWHGAAPDDWRACFAKVKEHYFSRKAYPGNCHIMPNGAIIVLALLYSGGDFSKAINISNMCGFDTDCNTANVGTIMGVRGGLACIEESWLTPINDFLCASSVIGSLNQLDVPAVVLYIADKGYRLAGEQPPKEYRAALEGTVPRYHFTLPGSTHAFRLGAAQGVKHNLRHTQLADGKRCLQAAFDVWSGGEGCRAWVQTYYSAKDFDDTRYDPCFSPILYPGQTIAAEVMVPNDIGIKTARARLFARDTAGREYFGETSDLRLDEWHTLRYDIPSMQDVCIEAAGVEWLPLEQGGPGEGMGFIGYVGWMDFTGGADYTVDFAKETEDEWTPIHTNVHKLSFLRGHWRLEDGRLAGSYCGEPAEAYTGGYDWQDYSLEAGIIPVLGQTHNINARVQGAMRGYAAGLGPKGTVKLYKNDHGYKELASAAFPWRHGEEYTLKLTAKGNQLTVWAGGVQLLVWQDDSTPYLHGCAGFSNNGGAATHYTHYRVCKL